MRIEASNEFHKGWLAYLLGQRMDVFKSEAWQEGWRAALDTPPVVEVKHTIEKMAAIGLLTIKEGQ